MNQITGLNIKEIIKNMTYSCKNQKLYRYLSTRLQRELKPLLGDEQIKEETIAKLLYILGIEINSRKKIIALAVILKAGCEKADEFLDEAGFTKLYVRIQEDALWMYALMHKLGYYDVQKMIKEYLL